MTAAAREDMATSIRALRVSPLFDRPTGEDDTLRRHAFCRAAALVIGGAILGYEIVMRHAGPTLLIDGYDPQPLYWPRGGKR